MVYDGIPGKIPLEISKKNLEISKETFGKINTGIMGGIRVRNS